MLEDIARTTHIAEQLGTPNRLDQRDIDNLYHRYKNVYGQ
jgi:L-ribulose-5-phosphate 4-epimerase